jgi:hypothetical protein
MSTYNFETMFRELIPKLDESYLRTHRPPTLLVWGKHDPFFTSLPARRSCALALSATCL